MITRFDSLFAGHVDLDDVGYDGTPVNERWLSDEQLATVFDKSRAIAELMDRAGYHTFWLAEHHFQREGYEAVPNILMLAVHLAQLTERLKFGCGFNVTPMWHPLRLAEDFATADILTGGRVVFGVGRGYHTREVETFGAPMLDAEANRELFEEQVEIIFKAFNERAFSHQGKHYTLPPRVPYRGYELEELTLVPKPLHRPVECYQPIVSANPRGLDFMAMHGIKGVIGGGAAAGGARPEVVQAWQETLARHGRETELGGDLVVTYTIWIAESEEQAIREATPFFEENVKMFAPLGFVKGLTPEQVEAAADPGRARRAGLPTVAEAVRNGSWLVGPPEGIVERLLETQKRWPGLEEVNVGHPVGTPERYVLEQLDLFAKHVMPTFKAQARVPTPAGGGA
jgi:alkanesulfonate monooxygenase SsuD/methylene tetrahydromethanopterin reductase-like flavin-dependent oxidoreductase (luciferase family)